MISTARHRIRVAALAAAGALAAGGCGVPSPQVVTVPGPRSAPCGTVTLAVNPWVGYEANAAVVSYLLRHELGCTVKTTTERATDSWKHLAAGTVDAILENWGHDDLKKLYIDEQKVAVEAGLTGNRGGTGWYVPAWMAEEHPDITSWRNLNRYAGLFSTRQSAGRGQLLDGDGSRVTNNSALVKNLRLNFTVVHAGSEEALIEAFRKAQRDRTPLLGHFYSPHWLHSEIRLVRIDLPQYTPGCDADPNLVACDYQPYDLDTIENRGFAYSGSPAAQLIQRYSWTNDDQNEVARDLAVRTASPDQAARRWLDGHRETWQTWLPEPAR